MNGTDPDWVVFAPRGVTVQVLHVDVVDDPVLMPAEGAVEWVHRRVLKRGAVPPDRRVAFNTAEWSASEPAGEHPPSNPPDTGDGRIVNGELFKVFRTPNLYQKQCFCNYVANTPADWQNHRRRCEEWKAVATADGGGDGIGPNGKPFDL